MLKQELDSLNDRDKEFTVIDTGAKYTLFISLSSVDTNQVAKAIYQVNFAMLTIKRNCLKKTTFKFWSYCDFIVIFSKIFD